MPHPRVSPGRHLQNAFMGYTWVLGSVLRMILVSMLWDFTVRPSCNGADSEGVGFTLACYWLSGTAPKRQQRMLIKALLSTRVRRKLRNEEKALKLLSFPSCLCQGLLWPVILSLNRRTLKSSSGHFQRVSTMTSSTIRLRSGADSMPYQQMVHTRSGLQLVARYTKV